MISPCSYLWESESSSFENEFIQFVGVYPEISWTSSLWINPDFHRFGLFGLFAMTTASENWKKIQILFFSLHRSTTSCLILTCFPVHLHRKASPPCVSLFSTASSLWRQSPPAPPRPLWLPPAPSPPSGRGCPSVPPPAPSDWTHRSQTQLWYGDDVEIIFDISGSTERRHYSFTVKKHPTEKHFKLDILH